MKIIDKLRLLCFHNKFTHHCLENTFKLLQSINNQLSFINGATALREFYRFVIELNWLNLPIQLSWLSSICIDEEADLSWGITTAENPKIKPVLIVPIFAMNAAITWRRALPRSFLSNCDSTRTVPFGFVFTICGFVLPLLPIRETFCWGLLFFLSNEKNWFFINTCEHNRWTWGWIWTEIEGREAETFPTIHWFEVYIIIVSLKLPFFAGEVSAK